MTGAQVRMATFSQHHVDGLDLALSPLAYMLKCFPLTKDQEQRCAPAAAAAARSRSSPPSCRLARVAAPARPTHTVLPAHQGPGAAVRGRGGRCGPPTF